MVKLSGQSRFSGADEEFGHGNISAMVATWTRELVSAKQIVSYPEIERDS
jgi:hypothetical protein